MTPRPYYKRQQTGRERPAGRLAHGSTLRAPTQPMAKMSPKRSAEVKDERPVRQAWKRWRPYCEGKQPHVCVGDLEVHEPWTRARGGPTDDPRNMATLCSLFNRLVSQDPEAMAWAEGEGLLISAAAGPAWLAAGGRFKGMSAADVLDLIGYRR